MKLKENINIKRIFLVIISVMFIFLLFTFSSSDDAQQSQAFKELQFSGSDNPYYYPSLNDPSNFLSWRNEFCSKSEGMDFIVEIPPDACSPSPVTSDLLEEQNVPVLCKLTGIKINPLISVPNIKKVVPIIENQSKEIAYISFYPARSALGNYNFNDQFQVSQGAPTLNNLGYLLLFLKQQPVEKNMSRNVSAKITVNITYDVSKTYGISTEQFILPVLSPAEWQDQYKKYGFWNGRGYLRLQEIKGQNAKIAVYTGPNSAPIATKELREEQGSLQVNLPGFYCEGPVNITLDKIMIPTTGARFLINGNDFILSETDEFADSGCVVSKIDVGKYLGGEVHISCQGHVGRNQYGDYVFKVDPIEAKINLIDFSNPSGVEKILKVGDELEVNISQTEKQYYYVAFIGKTADLSGASIGKYTNTDSIIFFALDKRLRINDEAKQQKFVQIIQSVINSKSLDSLSAEDIKTAANQNYQVSNQISEIKIFKKSMKLTTFSTNSKLELLSTTGPIQVTYSKEIEAEYKTVIDYYKTISAQFPRLADPDGNLYGIVALRAASELAGYLSKQNDQIELLQSIIDKYQDINDPYIQGEVEAAKSDILLFSQGSGKDRSKIIETDSGTYHVTLLSINRPGLNSQEARLRINNSEAGVYFLNDQIADIIITEITDDGIGITYDNGKTDFITKGTTRIYNATKLEVISTLIRREAKVTVWPFEKERTTTTNFSVVIGISKRAIQLTPDQINKKIKDLNKTIDTLNKYVDFLEKTTSTWKKVCYVGGTVLWTKNFLGGITGQSFARRMVMKAWSQKCSSEEYRTELGGGRSLSLSSCYFKSKESIEKDVNLVTTSVNNANDFVKKVKAIPGVVSSGGLLGLSKKINEEKFINESKNLFLKEQLSLIQDVRVTIPLGSLTKAQKDALVIKDKIKNDPTTYCASETGTGKTLNELFLLDATGLTKELKKCEVSIPVEVKPVIENLNVIYEEGDISSEDIKELFLILSINKQSNSVSKVLRDYNNYQIFSKFETYSRVADETRFQNNIKARFGIDPPFWTQEKTKSMVVSQIYTLTDDKLAWFNDSDTDNQGKTTREIASESLRKPFIIFRTKTTKVFAILEQVGEPSENKYFYNPAYNITDGETISILKNANNERAVITPTEESLPDFVSLQDIGKCNHEVNSGDYQIKFWESGPYEGLVAQMIISRNGGWYYTTKAYSGVEGRLVSYKETGQVNEYWICNVGSNGRPEFNFYSGVSGDDECCFQISKTTNMEIPEEIKAKAEEAEKCLTQAQTSYQKKERPINAGKCGKQALGKPPALIPSSQCEDFMSPEDCRVLFNLCDPVICPPSRCDMGGRFPVENVIQSGIIGSLVLCLGNSDEVAVPICVSGLYNGLDALNNMVFKQYRECLQKQLDTGQTTGLCDYWHSVYLCQLLWGNLDPFIKAGLPLVTQSVSQGGGEYSLFSEAIKNADDSLGFFTQVYGKNTFFSFKEKATNQTGTMICDKYASIVVPTAAKFVEDLTKADSYYSLYASIDEVTLGSNPESQYRVFYDIYAGKDRSVSYYVYIKKPTSSSGYEYQFDQLSVRNAQGFLSPGQSRAEKVDFTAPPGYNQICINVNGKEHCFLGSGGTSFLISEIQNKYLEDEIKKDIKTEQVCKAGSATIMPTASLNLQSQIQEHLRPEIYRRGIIRICASEDPSAGTSDPERYRRVGYCDNPKVGCWLDMNSVNNSISDLGIRKNIAEYAKDLSWTDLLDKDLADLPSVTGASITGLKTRLAEVRKRLYGASMKIDSGQGIYNQYLNRIKSEIDAIGLTDPESLNLLKTEITSHEIIGNLSDIAREATKVSERALKSGDKAEGESIRAQALDDRLRFLSLTEMMSAQFAVSSTCEDLGGEWVQTSKDSNKCPDGSREEPYTKDKTRHLNEICCVKENQGTPGDNGNTGDNTGGIIQTNYEDEPSQDTSFVEMQKQEFSDRIKSVVSDNTLAQIIMAIAIKEQNRIGTNTLKFPDHNAWGIMVQDQNQDTAYGWGSSRSQWAKFKFSSTEGQTKATREFVGFETYRDSFLFMQNVWTVKRQGYVIKFGDDGEQFARAWHQKWGPASGEKNPTEPSAAEKSELQRIWKEAYNYISKSIKIAIAETPTAQMEVKLPQAAPEIIIATRGGSHRFGVKFNRQKNIWECEGGLNWGYTSCSSASESMFFTTQQKAIAFELSRRDETNGYAYLKEIYLEKNLLTGMTLSGTTIEKFFDSVFFIPSTTTQQFLFKWPVKDYGDISGYVGDSRGDRNHAGLDIYTTRGKEVYAIYDGTIINSRNECSCDSGTSTQIDKSYNCGGKYGNNIVIQHTINGHTFYSRYAHLETVSVSVGAKVTRGQTIGSIGNTGNACFRSLRDTTPGATHLHFEIQYPESLGNPKDPLCFFTQGVLSLAGLDSGRYDSSTCASALSGLGLSISDLTTGSSGSTSGSGGSSGGSGNSGGSSGGSSSTIQKVYLVSNAGAGYTSESKTIGLNDNVEICAVLQKDNQYYSGKAFTAKIDGSDKSVLQSSDSITIRWYNVQSLSQSYDGDQVRTNAQRIQYRQNFLNTKSGWCVNADNKEGSYWFRVEVVSGSDTYSSLGKTDSNNYLESAAYSYGIDKVLRVSKKSSNSNSVIAYMESFKNVPFVGRSFFLDYNGGSIHMIEPYKGIECFTLLAVAVKKVYNVNPANYELEDFIVQNSQIVEIIKSGSPMKIEKVPIRDIASLGIPFEKGNVIFLFNSGLSPAAYDHTVVLYEDIGMASGYIDLDDSVIYTSSDCIDSAPTTQRGVLVRHEGNICYTTLRRFYEVNSPGTLVKVKTSA